MVDSLDEQTRANAAAMVTAKRDQLLAERQELTAMRADILARMRRNERELADCRAAARLFGLEIEFPADEREEAERLMTQRRERDMIERELIERDARRRAAERNAAVHHLGPVGTPGPVVARVIQPPQPPPRPTPPAPSPVVPTISSGQNPNRPPLREILLEQLKIAGDAGAKAAPLRDFYEQTYGEIIHEKTVGMTLYRLSKHGLVRRDGHLWFFVPPQAETKNPGAVTPGQSNIFD